MYVTFKLNPSTLHLYQQITHLRDFKYWEIYRGLTVKQIKERERNFEYPPRLKINCEHMDTSTKPLQSRFTISKRSKDKEIPIAQFPLVKKVTGMYIIHDIYVATVLPQIMAQAFISFQKLFTPATKQNW